MEAARDGLRVDAELQLVFDLRAPDRPGSFPSGAQPVPSDSVIVTLGKSIKGDQTVLFINEFTGTGTPK